jgi:hypothetical protein
MSEACVRRPRTVSEGDGAQGNRRRVLAGGAQPKDGGAFPGDRSPGSGDPLVIALAQLVRDRWAIEGRARSPGVAFPRHLMNMTVMVQPRSPDPEGLG